MLVSIATKRLGKVETSSAVNAGRMASSIGSARQTPVPRMKVRRFKTLDLVTLLQLNHFQNISYFVSNRSESLSVLRIS